MLRATVPTTFNVHGGNIWSANLDGTFDVARWGVNQLSSLYLIGGGGLHRFSKPKVDVTPLSGPGVGTTTLAEGDTQTKFGLNGGAGIAFAIGRTALTLESRYFTAYTDRTNSEWVPVIVGIRWY